MGPSEPPDRITLAATLSVFEETEDPGEPLTASEVGEALDCSRRTAYDKLTQLAEEGELKSKKTGARGRVWWRPIEGPDGRGSDGTSIDQSQFDELVQAVTNYAIFALDPDGRVVTWNDGAERLKGYEREEITGEHFSTFYTEEDREAKVPDRNLAAAVRQGYVEDEGWRVRADGDRFWADVTITAITDDDGNLDGFIKVTRDMTDVREYENQLRQEKERFQSLVQEVEDYAIFMLDPEGYVQSWNSGIERIKGYERDEIVGEHFSRFYTPEDREGRVPERNLAAAAASGRTHDEGWRVRADGDWFWADVTITALRDDDGDLRGFAKVTRDMTEQHEYEERLLTQRDELDELNRINADIRDVAKAIVSATTREEIEERVCDRIAASGAYSASWIGEYGPGDGFEIRTAAGVDDHLDVLADSADGDAPVAAERPLGAAALRSRSVETMRRDGETTAEGLPEDAGLLVDFASVAVIPLVYEDVEYGVLAVYSAESDAFDERKTAVLGELGETISHAITAIRHKEREQALTTLHESTRDLLHAETREEIAEIVVSTATATLEMDGAIVYGFDTTDNLLVPLTVSPHSEALEDASRAFRPGDDSEVWSSFVDGETAFVERADEVFPGARTLGLREALVVPLGDHGVIVVGWQDVEAFEADSRKLVELLGSTAQAAFHRVESEANLREREEALQSQNRRLQRLNELNSVVREVSQRLVGATSREEIQNDVCEVLTRVDRFRFAWIGGHDAADSDHLTPLAWSGTGQSYLDHIAADADDRLADPATTAARSGEITIVSNVADDLRAAPWRKEAFSREFQSVVSVPLTYGEHSYGVLSVYGDRPGLFDDMEQSVFAELGYSIAHAINTVEMKQALLADRVTELEFRLQSDLDALLPRLARLTESHVEFEGIIPTSDGGVRIFFTTREGDPDAVLDQLEGSAAVEGARLITERDGGALFEARVVEDAIAARLVDYNASLRDLTATNEAVHATIEVPSSTDVRAFVERFQSEYPGVEFLARRERDRSIETPERFRSRLEDALTDRQLEVLEMAYYSGYFDSPRGSTGGDLAEALDVSQPTVTTHLRTAQRKLLDQLLESQ